MSLGASRPGGITINERRKLLKAERRAAQDRTCATCPTKLSCYNDEPLCGPCRYKDSITVKPLADVRKRRCRYCHESYETTNSRRILCPPCYERHLAAS